MLKPDKKSLLCDHCGGDIILSGDKLLYYSVNFKKVDVEKQRTNCVDDTLDLDMCEKCYNSIFEIAKDVIIKNNMKIKQLQKNTK